MIRYSFAAAEVHNDIEYTVSDARRRLELFLNKNLMQTFKSLYIENAKPIIQIQSCAI